jgi:hypothetical protein
LGDVGEIVGDVSEQIIPLGNVWGNTTIQTATHIHEICVCKVFEHLLLCWMNMCTLTLLPSQTSIQIWESY